MIESLSVPAWDGYPISTTHFIPEKSGGKVLLIVNGVGEPQSRYSLFAGYFAEEGFDVYTFDFRGIGESRSRRLTEISADMKDWASLDLDAVISYIEGANPTKRMAIVAHGFGGLLTGFSRMSRKADAFVFVGCQAPHHKNLKGLMTNLKYAALARILIPLTTSIFGYFPSSKFALCHDVPSNIARQLVEWSKSEKEILNDINSNDHGFRVMDQPVLSIGFSDDPIATSSAISAFHSLFDQMRPTQWLFSPEQLARKSVGHYGFFRKAMKPVLWSDVLKWTNAALSSSRSKAA